MKFSNMTSNLESLHEGRPVYESIPMCEIGIYSVNQRIVSLYYSLCMFIDNTLQYFSSHMVYLKAVCSCGPVFQSWCGKKFGSEAFGRTVEKPSQ